MARRPDAFPPGRSRADLDALRRRGRRPRLGSPGLRPAGRRGVPGPGPVRAARSPGTTPRGWPGSSSPTRRSSGLLAALAGRTRGDRHQRVGPGPAGQAGRARARRRDRPASSSRANSASPSPTPPSFLRALAWAGCRPGGGPVRGRRPRATTSPGAGVGMATCWVSAGRPYPAGCPRPDRTIGRVADLAGGPAMIDVAALIGTHDVLLVTLDTLRYDVARDALAAGRTPNLAAVLPGGAWEERHSPGSFTYAAHHAFFAGFLPTPAAARQAPAAVRRRASRAARRPTDATCVFDAPDIVTGLAGRGYHTVCVGGVGFFNKQSPLGSVLPGLFAESHWAPGAGRDRPALDREPGGPGRRDPGRRSPADRRVFLFVNVSAIHQPNCFYLRRGRRGLRSRRTPRPWPTSTGSCRRCSRRCAGAGPSLRDRLLGPRHRLRRGRLPGPSPGPPGRLDRPLRRVPPAGGDAMTHSRRPCSTARPTRATPTPTRTRPPTGRSTRRCRSATLWAGERRDALFLYIHVPFCGMRCGFCNLFTTARPPAGPGRRATSTPCAGRPARVRDALGDGAVRPVRDRRRHADLPRRRRPGGRARRRRADDGGRPRRDPRLGRGVAGDRRRREARAAPGRGAWTGSASASSRSSRPRRRPSSRPQQAAAVERGPRR